MPLLDKLRKLYGVGPVCSELHIAPSTYYGYPEFLVDKMPKM